MLTSETKQKIDNARDILVGKIPTPTGQVEQITLALIYKFMNDIDEEQVEFGGKSKYFNSKYKQYAWKHILDRSLSAFERVTLYGEGLEKMNLNPNLPQFFRNVFKGAFLPFRDPEVLTLFLKQIDEFKYGHNGDLGDAFEYLLQVMGTQGDAGQFLTPRHIIHFIVNVVEPDINDRIMDPACGTGGFLISAYKFIVQHKNIGAPNNSPAKLTITERKKLANNFNGYDISHDMVRLSLVNLYLHDFPDPKIQEYDTLTSLDKWDDDFECIMTNPPFMTPKGGIRPHKRFSIQAKRSELLFVDYILEHLTPNGKAGIIVPEGIIFQSANAYKSLRKMLVGQNYLYAVASLPGGVFQPYSGVKTSILFLDKVLAKRCDQILFVKIENDGFDLGAQRKPLDKNDLPLAEEILKRWKSHIQTSQVLEIDRSTEKFAHLVSKETILQSSDMSLDGDRYKQKKRITNRKWSMIDLGEICSLIGGGTPLKSNKEYWANGSIKWISAKHISEDRKITSFELINEKAVGGSSTNVLPRDSIIFVTRVSVGKFALTYEEFAINQDLTGIVVKDKDKINSKFLFFAFSGISKEIEKDAQGLGVRGVTREYMRQIKIPLPPLEIQREIVNQLDGYQNIIDGAKQIISNYKPEIKIDPSWEMKELRDLCNEIKCGFASGGADELTRGVPHIRPMNIERSGLFTWEGTKYISAETFRDKTEYSIKRGDVLFNNTNSKELVGKTCWVGEDISGGYSNHITRIRPNPKILDSKYLSILLFKFWKEDYFIERCHRWIGQAGINNTVLTQTKIPLPPVETQKEIVVRIEEEQQIVAANRKLIQIYEEKIKVIINELWREGATE